MRSLSIVPGIQLTNDRMVWIPSEQVLAVADLHLGYEISLEAEGTYLPRTQSQNIVDTLARAIDEFSPRMVVLVGDIRHGFGRPNWEERREIEEFVEWLGSLTDIVIIKGNHDNFLQNMVGGRRVMDSVKMGTVTFAHGHEIVDGRPLVMGHEHPSIRLVDSVNAHVKLSCFLYLVEQNIIVMPALSPLAGGNDLASQEASLSPMLRDIDIDEGRVIACSEIGLMDLGRLGGLKGLKL